MKNGNEIRSGSISAACMPLGIAVGLFVAISVAVVATASRSPGLNFSALGESAPPGQAVSVGRDNAYIDSALLSGRMRPVLLSASGDCPPVMDSLLRGTWTVLGRADEGEKRMLVEARPEGGRDCVARLLVQPFLLGAAVAWNDAAPDRARAEVERSAFAAAESAANASEARSARPRI